MERPGHWESPNAEVECPEGLQHTEKDNWNALDESVREQRSRHFGHRWNRGRVDDPEYNEWVARARAAATLDERKEAVRQADYRLAGQHWYTWGPSAPSFNVTQPWGRGFNGDTFLGNGQANAVFARLWIDRR